MILATNSFVKQHQHAGKTTCLVYYCFNTLLLTSSGQEFAQIGWKCRTHVQNFIYYRKKWKWVPGTFLGVKAPCAWGWQPHHSDVPNVMKSGSLNLLEPSGPHRARYGTALPFLPKVN